MATTSLMNLKLSTPGVTSDPEGSQNDQDNWATIDVHDHSSGKGTQIPTAGININANLGFGGYVANNLLATSFSDQTGSLSTSNKPCVYVLNGDLRFINSSGTDVQLTNGGSVAGTAGSVSGITGNVSAGFSTDTFTWKTNSATDLKAKMAFSDIKLYEYSAGVSNFVTIQSPAALAASYTVTMPAAVPGSTQYMTMSSAGAIALQTADSIGSAMTSTGSNAIASVRTRSTGTSVGAGGVAISSSSGTFSSSSGSETDVTNLSVTITTSGRPVMIALISDGTTAYVGASASSSDCQVFFQHYRDLTKISVHALREQATGATATLIFVPQGAIQTIDTPAAGTYTYKLKASVFGSATVTVQNCKLIAYEL